MLHQLAMMIHQFFLLAGFAHFAATAMMMHHRFVMTHLHAMMHRHLVMVHSHMMMTGPKISRQPNARPVRECPRPDDDAWRPFARMRLWFQRRCSRPSRQQHPKRSYSLRTSCVSPLRLSPAANATSNVVTTIFRAFARYRYYTLPPAKFDINTRFSW